MTLPPSFDLRSLEIFLTVVRSGGMTSAAQSLGLTQSAVSQSIAALEKSLGSSLLNRSVRPIQLTPSGVLLSERTQSLLGMAVETVQRVSAPESHVMEKLHIAMPDSFSCTVGPFLVQAIGDIARHWRITSGLSGSHERALKASEVDIAILADSSPEMHPDYEYHPLFEEQFVVAAPSSYKGPKNRFDLLLRDYKFVRYSLTSFVGRKVEQNLNRWRLYPTLWLEIDSPMAQFSMIAQDIAWGLTTPTFLAQAPQRAEALTLFPSPKGTVPRHAYLVARRGQYADIPQRMAQASRQIIREKLIPEITALQDWLADLISIPTDDNPNSVRQK